MKGFEALRVALVFAIMVVLHYLVRPILDWRASPDFLMIGLLIVAIRVRPGTGALVGFLIGAVQDSLHPQTFGAAALSYTAVGFAASWMKAVFFADDLWLNAFFLFLGKIAFELLYLLTSWGAGGAADLATRLLVWAPLSAAVTAAFGVVALIMVRPMLRTTSP